MSDQPVLIERHEPVGIVTINRPTVLNAIDVPTIRELDRGFKELGRFAPVSEEMILNYIAVHDLGMVRSY